jgi:uncharacterized protein (DUF169 family)
MSDYARLESSLRDALQLTRRPVAVAFRDAPVEGIARLEGTHPSGCTFWSIAAAGRAFYTVPEDHYNCPIGSYTHNIPLPPEREGELTDTLGLMARIGYVRMEEVGGIPRLAQTPAITIYAPLGETPVTPDAVIVAGTPSRLMLLHEAATRAGVTTAPLLGRPTCMAIPAAISAGAASSLGCIGNRIYTGLADDEFYTVVRADQLDAIAAEMATLETANATLADYHRGRRLSLA